MEMWLIGFTVAVFLMLPKRYISTKIVNYYKFRTLRAPIKTVVVILDDIGLNYEKARIYAKRGALIIMGGRDLLKLAAAKKEIAYLTKNNNILTKKVNRFDKDSLKQFAQEIMDLVVSVDSIINNEGRELQDLDIIFTTQSLAKERFENHCLNFLYKGLPDDL